LSFQQFGYMSHRMSDLRSFRSFRSVLPFRWLGLNFGRSWTPNLPTNERNLVYQMGGPCGFHSELNPLVLNALKPRMPIRPQACEHLLIKVCISIPSYRCRGRGAPPLQSPHLPDPWQMKL